MPLQQIVGEVSGSKPESTILIGAIRNHCLGTIIERFKQMVVLHENVGCYHWN